MSFHRGWCSLFVPFAFLSSTVVSAQRLVPDQPPKDETPQTFRDGRFGVQFRVPEGWNLVRKDKQVSTFHLDARTAPPDAVMRSVAAIDFNPYPYSTFAGALFYFSVQPHATDAECSRQATGPRMQSGLMDSSGKDVQDIGGMSFAHGHDEHGQICVEARDEVYTAYRNGACYRFDLAMNTFCGVSSGAVDMTVSELQQIDQRMADILSTVQLDWEKEGPHHIPAPPIPILPTGRPAQMSPVSLPLKGAEPDAHPAAKPARHAGIPVPSTGEQG